MATDPGRIDPGLRRLALRTLLPAFRGQVAPAWITELIGEGLVGCIIFGYNIVDRDQLTALTGQLLDVRSDLLLSITGRSGWTCWPPGST